MSFQITISPSRQAAARFVTKVRRALQKAYVEEQDNGVTQTSIAREIGVHRSVINRELRGKKDMTIGRVAEFARALGREPTFDLPKRTKPIGSNIPIPKSAAPTPLPTPSSDMPGIIDQILLKRDAAPAPALHS